VEGLINLWPCVGKDASTNPVCLPVNVLHVLLCCPCHSPYVWYQYKALKAMYIRDHAKNA